MAESLKDFTSPESNIMQLNSSDELDSNNRVSKHDQGNEEKEMAEKRELEVPTVQTPLKQTKKKRRSDETVSGGRLHKRPRKKMYRPKVIGEGRKRKVAIAKTNLDPLTPSPLTPGRARKSAASRGRIRKKMPAISDQSLVVTTQDNYNAGEAQISCQQGPNLDQNGCLESERDSTAVVVHKEDIQMPENGIYRHPVGVESENSMEIEGKPPFRVFQRRVKLNGGLCDGHLPRLEIPNEFKRKRTARRRKMNMLNNLNGMISLIEESQHGTNIRKWKLRFIVTEREKQHESGYKLPRRSGNQKDFDQPLFLIIKKKKRTPMVRRCNLAPFYGFPFRNRYVRCYKNTLKSDITKSFSVKRNDEKGRDDGGCEAVENPVTDGNGNTEGMLTNGLAQKALPPASNKFLNLQSTGTIWKMGNFQHAEKISENRGQLTERWLDMKNYVSKSKFFSGTQKEGAGLFLEKQIIPYQQEQNASYAKSKQGAIVPYNSTKTKRGLDIVHLDPRSITMWELLVKNEGRFGKEKMDANTAEWWANERKVFRGRIDAFVARLHPILGDRRFSQWKGSVVDSVVGVFLTQNVSDHHSSSAFMSLAAAFPLPSTKNPTENPEGQEDISKIESNKTIVEEAGECVSPKEATASQELPASSIKQNPDRTQFSSSTFLEEDCRTCVSSIEKDSGVSTCCRENSKKDFWFKPDEESQRLVDSIRKEQSREIRENNDANGKCNLNVECSGQTNSGIEETAEIYNSHQGNPGVCTQLSSNNDATEMLRSSCDYHLCHECSSSQTKSVLEKNIETCNCCQRTSGVDLLFKPDEESRRLVDGTGNVQSEEIQATHDANGQCHQSVECSSQTKSGVEESTEIYNSHQEKTDIGTRLSPSNELSERTVQAAHKANGIRKKGKKEKHHQNLDDKKQTETPIGHNKKTKEKQEIDWDSLQKKWDSMRSTYSSQEPRNSDNMDFVDWEAVRCAEPSKIANAIKERGQHNIMAGRIKEFLDRVVRLHGSLDLEWLRNAPPDDVKEYLLGINGIGLKSVECIRLLALQQVAFPVDINVGRIAVRLGWVPLEPLPEEVQIHLLELFPMMNSIQRYLWPRLCTLDQRTLYELHYQLITFGKVFCTKRHPNCNACPLRAECKHYASVFASAKLMLPGPTDEKVANSMVPYKAHEGTTQVMNPLLPLPHMENNSLVGSRFQTNNCEPIIEEPSSPDPGYAESSLTDIEDLCGYDSDDIPAVRLNSGQLTTSQKYLDAEDEMLEDSNIIRALVPISTRAAYVPMRKLKHVDRLRTEHQVYELPDTHPLLLKFEPRERSDPCPYLLCIMTPGENVNSSEPPNTRCKYKDSGELCSEGACSSCNAIREQNNGTIRGTILIPCRTAMRGVFPLNGTYFQVNEVFADDETSKDPIHVPRRWIWNLPRRTAYFGTSTTTIFRGLVKEEIQYCFQRGFMCVRGFDRKTRTPKRLVKRLHMSTIVAGKSKVNKHEE